jgi:hypothetical protein
MDTIKGVVENGQIIVPAPPDWPEGTEVQVQRVAPAPGRIGLDESEWRDDPEAVAEWLRWYNDLEPLEFTPEEESEIAAWRQKRKELELASFPRRGEGLFV